MKKLVASLLLASFICPAIAHAEDASPPKEQPVAVDFSEIEGPEVITPVQKGQPAPFAGILFSPRAAAVVGTEIASHPEKLKIEVDAAVKKAEAQKDFKYNELNTTCTSDKSQLQARIEANEKRIKILEKDLQDAIDDAPNRFVWLGIGAGAGIALTVVTVFAVSQATK